MDPRDRAAMTAAVERVLRERCGGAWTARALGASGFCATWRAEGPAGALFVKSLPVSQAEVLAAEADGLAALAATRTVAVPAVVGCWCDDAQGLAVLALEWLDLRPVRAADFGARLGRALAALHRAPLVEGAGRYGWRRDNMLGGTAQRNRWSAGGGLAGWIEFFGRERLGALRDRLAAAGAPAALAAATDRVIAALPAFFDDGHVPRPALIHGDLWSGNWGGTAGGTPVIFDPAVSVSDAEAELAMMELFGAPPAGFWPAYREAAGLSPGYGRRRDLYQLHHLLNHELLFGGYAGQAMAAIGRLLGRTGR
jgi:fructosamine-3-kinase